MIKVPQALLRSLRWTSCHLILSAQSSGTSFWERECSASINSDVLEEFNTCHTGTQTSFWHWFLKMLRTGVTNIPHFFTLLCFVSERNIGSLKYLEYIKCTKNKKKIIPNLNHMWFSFISFQTLRKLGVFCNFTCFCNLLKTYVFRCLCMKIKTYITTFSCGEFLL